MPKEPTYLEKLRALTRGEPNFSHLDAIEKELYGDSDRATAIVYGSFLDNHLKSLIQSRLRNDLNSSDKKQIFEHEGALGSFSSRILMAYAMSLIGPTARKDLDLIRFLRNEFAHSRIPLNFETTEVRAACAHLRYPDLPGSRPPLGPLSRAFDGRFKDDLDKSHPRTRYVTACHTLSYRMLVKRDGSKEGDGAFDNDEPLP